MPKRSDRLVGYQVPRSNRFVIRIVLATVIMTLAILAVLPFTQALSGDPRDRTIRSVEVANIPPPEPPPPEPPPPPEEEEREETPELDQSPQMLDLSQLESALNPGIGGVGQAIDLFAFATTQELATEIQIFDISDLDRRPRRLRAIPPNFPIEMQTRGARGVVRARILIDETGAFSVLEIVEATDREAVQPVRQALVQWRFEPPEKGGEKVRATYIQPITYDWSN
jgi:periplasmic protein TonB